MIHKSRWIPENFQVTHKKAIKDRVTRNRANEQKKQIKYHLNPNLAMITLNVSNLNTAIRGKNSLFNRWC